MLALPSFIACTPIGPSWDPIFSGGTILLIALRFYSVVGILGYRKRVKLNCDADQLRFIVDKG